MNDRRVKRETEPSLRWKQQLIAQRLQLPRRVSDSEKHTPFTPTFRQEVFEVQGDRGTAAHVTQTSEQRCLVDRFLGIHERHMRWCQRCHHRVPLAPEQVERFCHPTRQMD